MTVDTTTIEIEITAASAEKVYDGTPLTDDGYELTSGKLAEGNVIQSVTLTGSQLNVGSSDNVASEAMIVDADGNDVTAGYTITYVKGTLEVTPLEVTVTITGKKETKVYTGAEQKAEGYDVEISDPLYTEADFSFSGKALAKGTVVGFYPMGLAEDQFENTNDNFTVTFVVNDGSLTIVPTENTVMVVIKGKTDTVVYDGAEHTVTGYEIVSISDPLYTEADFSFSGSANAKGTNVGTYAMGLTPADFANINANFADVLFVVTDGELEITPKEITVTADDFTKMESEDDPVFTAKIAGLADGDDESLIVYTISREPGEEPGEYAITPAGEEVQGNYKVTFVPGTLTITALPMYNITFDPNGGILIIDGKEYTSDEMYVITVKEGTVITIVDAPERDGFVFTYWRGSEYQPGDEYTVFEDHTFTAQWEAEEIPPKTGDESVIFLWTGMMVMALVGTGFTLVMKKREEEAE